MLEVEPTGHRGHMTTGSGRNGIDLEKFMSSICSWLIIIILFVHKNNFIKTRQPCVSKQNMES